MAEFVVAYLSVYNGEIVMTQLRAKDEQDALITVLELDPKVFNTLEAIYQYSSDSEAYVAVHQI